MGDAMPGEHAIHGLETDGESSDVLEHARMLDQSCIWMIIKLTEQLGFMCAGHTARSSWRGEHEPQLPLLIQIEIPLYGRGMHRELLRNRINAAACLHSTDDPFTQFQRIPSPADRFHAFIMTSALRCGEGPPESTITLALWTKPARILRGLSTRAAQALSQDDAAGERRPLSRQTRRKTMNKTLMTAVLALTLAAGSAFAAPNTVRVSASDGDGLSYTKLYTESSWMSLVVPMSALEYTVPGDLSLSVTGLPEGTTITLDGVTQRGNTLLLNVSVSRDDTSVGVNDIASIALMAGDQVLTTLTIPVMGVASSE